jgi:hypothetical protein
MKMLDFSLNFTALFLGLFLSAEIFSQTVLAISRVLDVTHISLLEGFRIEPVDSAFTFLTGVTFDESGRPYVVESGYAYGEDNVKFGCLKRFPDVCGISYRNITLSGKNYKIKHPFKPGEQALTGVFSPFGKSTALGQQIKEEDTLHRRCNAYQDRWKRFGACCLEFSQPVWPGPWQKRSTLCDG